MRATIRSAALREMLIEHQRRIQDDVYAVLRDSASSTSDVRDGEVWRAVLQTRAEGGPGIDDALRRLEAGRYGYCVACRKGISARRLNALPLASRCQACERRPAHAGS